ncbi:hypothetical protein ACF0H5_024419 [Mactra antiquata]
MPLDALSSVEINTTSIIPMTVVTAKLPIHYGGSLFPSDIKYNWNSTETKKLMIYMLSGIGQNFSELDGYEAEVKLSGWIAQERMYTKIKCCILKNSGDLIEYHEPPIVQGRQFALSESLVTCPIKSRLQDINGVVLQLNRGECPASKKLYIKVTAPIKPRNNESFAICLKILYGHVDVRLLVEWLEYYRLIGVDKIFMHIFDLSQEVWDVLRQYTKVGFVETRQYNYPRTVDHHLGEKIRYYYEDERVVMKDCHQRLFLFRFMYIVDMDEFLVPRKHDNVKDMMRDLTAMYPNAAGFTLVSYLFVKKIDQTFPPFKNNSNIGGYFKRTIGMIGFRSRNKSILLPTRVFSKELKTHKFLTVGDYERIQL